MYQVGPHQERRSTAHRLPAVTRPIPGRPRRPPAPACASGSGRGPPPNDKPMRHATGELSPFIHNCCAFALVRSANRSHLRGHVQPAKGGGPSVSSEIVGFEGSWSLRQLGAASGLIEGTSSLLGRPCRPEGNDCFENHEIGKGRLRAALSFWAAVCLFKSRQAGRMCAPWPCRARLYSRVRLYTWQPPSNARFPNHSLTKS